MAKIILIHCSVKQSCIFIFQKAVEIIQKDALRGVYPVNVTMEMRFTASSNTYLAMSNASSLDNGGSGQ